jgi:predicted outer membrane repeat protein
MRQERPERRVGARLSQFLALAVVVGAVVLAFGAGSAFAGGSYTCTGVKATDQPAVQGLINGGGTVTVYGPLPCVGNWTVPVSVTIQGGNSTAVLNGNATGSVLTLTADFITLTVRNVTVTNGSSADGGGIQANSFCGAIVNVQNAAVTGNTVTDDGGGIRDDCGTLNVVASTVSNNSAGDNGGAVYADGCGAAINVTNSTVANNTSVNDGGGILVFCSSVNLTGATVSGNTSSDDQGGGVVVFDDSHLNATASTITQNQALDGDGGGIYSDVSDVLLTNTAVTWNTTSSFGGGIEYAGGGSNNSLVPLLGTASAGVNGRGDQLQQIPSREHAGGVSSAVGKAPALLIPLGLNLVNSSVDHNSTTGSGGGGGIENTTACDGTSPVTLSNSSVSFNRVVGSDFDTDSGGGGYRQESDCGGDTASLVATGSSLIGNLARNSVGGGIFNVSYSGSALVTLGTTSIASGPPYLNPNQAMFGGGIFNWDTNANVALQPGGNIVHNKAFVNGGGVFNDCGATLTVTGGLITLNSPNQVFTNLGPCVVND